MPLFMKPVLLNPLFAVEFLVFYDNKPKKWKCEMADRKVCENCFVLTVARTAVVKKYCRITAVYC